jgi:acetyl-CoA carboxylase biotin carboxyl carrier protein
MAAPASQAAPTAAAPLDERPRHLVTVEAPMVGTFYRASSPDADPYVREGDTIKEGQVLCIIEAMKLMNEIESKVSGRVIRVLAENGQPVEYGQPLFLIEP